MKLAVLLSRFPYPLEKGDKLRAFHQIKELSKEHELYVFCVTDQDIKSEWRSHVQPYCKELHVFRLSRFMIYWNTAKQFLTDKPFQVGYFYQRGIQRKINKHFARIEPDHIYCQLIRTTEYVKHFHGIKKTLDYMDAFGIGMQRQASKKGGLRKKLTEAEAKRVTAYENRIFDFFDNHTIISEQDRQYINHPDSDKIKVVKNGIDDSFFNYSENVEKGFDLVFTGNMNYPPNIEAVEFIVKEIIPRLYDRNENVNLLISGANPHNRVKNLEQGKQVVVSGWVADIRESYARGKIFIAPLFIGTGLQNKLLEAMAMGIPCVTTPLVNNALGAENGKQLLIAEDANQFADRIEQLSADEELRNELGQAGREFVQSHYQWSTATAVLIDLIHS